MKRAGESAPGGVKAEGKRWLVPAVSGTWPEDREGLVDLALNGGVDGSLEGELSDAVVAEVLEEASAADRLALGLTEAQVDQFQRDYEAPLIEPQIDLSGLKRTAAAETAGAQTTVRLSVPPPLAERARALVKKGVTAAELLGRGVEQIEANGKKTTDPKGSRRRAAKAAKSAAGRKG
jgi:hypothetical protein